MLEFNIVVIYCILCIAGAVIKISKHNGKDKSVNLALETVFEFENDPKNTDVNILNNVQKFIGKVRNVIEHDSSGRRGLSNGNKKVFTNFVVDALQILIDFEDRQLEKMVSIISEEINNHHYAGCKFFELSDNIKKHKAIAFKFAEIRYKPPVQIRDDLKAIISILREEKYSDSAKKLIDTLNYLYKEDSIGKIQKFLTRLDNYRQKIKQYNNITNIISEGLKTIIFDHYTNLSVHLRSSLLSKLQNFIRHFKDNILETTNPVTKIKEMVPTQRQEYLEDEKHITSAQQKRKSKSKGKHLKRTSISRRPLDVPTTRRFKSDYSKEVLRNPKYERMEKKNRFVKVQRMPDDKDTSAHKTHRNTETTNQFRTFRQMYVEKNIDLKYDADAYEHLSTVKKHKSKKNTLSPTTKRRKHTYKRKPTTSYSQQDDVDDSDDSYNKDRSEETVLTDFIVDFSSESYSPKYKVTKMARNFDPTFNDKDDDDPFYRSGAKKLTSETLYPTFVIDWSTPAGTVGRQVGVTNEYKVRVPNDGSNERNQFYTYEPGRHGEIKLVKNLDYSIEVRKRKNWELGIHRKKNLRQNKERKDSPNSSETYLLKTGKLDIAHVPVMRQQGDSSREEKSQMTREPIIFAQQYEAPHRYGNKVFRRQFSLPRMVSEEGLSIEELKNARPINSHRRNNPSSKEGLNINNQVLKRILKLENELELVKSQINDHESVKPNKSGTLSQNKDKRIEKETIIKRSNSEPDTKKDTNEASNINTNKEEASKTISIQKKLLDKDSTAQKSFTVSTVQQLENNLNEKKVEMENKEMYNVSTNDTLENKNGSLVNQSSLVDAVVYKERRFNNQNVGKKESEDNKIKSLQTDINTQVNNSNKIKPVEKESGNLMISDDAKTVVPDVTKSNDALKRNEEAAPDTNTAVETSQMSVQKPKIGNKEINGSNGNIKENGRKELNVTTISNVTNSEYKTNKLILNSNVTVDNKV